MPITLPTSTPNYYTTPTATVPFSASALISTSASQTATAISQALHQQLQQQYIENIRARAAMEWININNNPVFILDEYTRSPPPDLDDEEAPYPHYIPNPHYYNPNLTTDIETEGIMATKSNLNELMHKWRNAGYYGEALHRQVRAVIRKQISEPDNRSAPLAVHYSATEQSTRNNRRLVQVLEAMRQYPEQRVQLYDEHKNRGRDRGIRVRGIIRSIEALNRESKIYNKITENEREVAYEYVNNNDFPYLWSVLQDYKIAGAILENNYLRKMFTTELVEFGRPVLFHCPNCSTYYADADQIMHAEYEDVDFCSNCDGDFSWSEYMNSYIRQEDVVQLYNSRTEVNNGYANDRVSQEYLDNHGYLTFRTDGIVAINGDPASPCTSLTTQTNGRLRSMSLLTSAELEYLENNYEFLQISGEYYATSALIQWVTTQVRPDSTNEDVNRGVYEYHHSPSREFYEHSANPAKHPPMGVEIEVYSSLGRDNAAKHIRANYNSKRIGMHKLLLERDGSLDPTCGLEVITQPYGMPEWINEAPPLIKALQAADCVGYNHPDKERNYGIHITVARKYLSPLQEARMMMFLISRSNKSFVTAIAQRQAIYRADHDIGSVDTKQHKLRHMGGTTGIDDGSGGYIRKPRGLGKFSPLNFKGELAEFRMFHSTLHIDSFMKNLEFVDALIAWTSPTACTGRSWEHEDFVKWLGERSREYDYPHLAAFLRKPSYQGRRVSKVLNTWKGLLPEVSTRSLAVEAGDADARLAA